MARNALDTLVERGFVHSVNDVDGLQRALELPLTFYIGFDPSAPSLTAGHFLQFMLAAHLQQAGHRAIFLAGGGTGLIGDPSDRSETRKLLSDVEVEANVAAISRQLERFVDLGEGRGEVVNNADWLRGLGYLEFLRDIGRHFSVNEMLATDTYRTRLESGQGLNFVEINYRLLQAYDFLHLYRARGCLLQAAGSDQWANILAGVELIRRVEGGEAFGLVSPLLTTSSGEKMGKTAGGTVWLDPAQTSPYEFYQYWINIDDGLVEPLLARLTFLPMERVRELGEMRGPDTRRAKEVLAHEVTATVHGVEAAAQARESSQALFGGPGERADAVSETLIDAAALVEGMPASDLLVTTGLVKSRGAARRLIEQGGAYLNDERIPSVEAVVGMHDLREDALLLRAGKKRYHRVRVRRP